MSIRRLLPQPLIGVGAVLVAMGVAAGSWAWVPLGGTRGQETTLLLLALCLLTALVASYRFPIHIRLGTKVYMGSVVLYLIATLLPPALAATTVFLGSLVGEFSVQASTGNRPSVIATQTGRWVCIALLGSLVAHFPGGDTTVEVVAAAVVLWAGDILTSPLVLAPITGERPLRIIALVAQGAGPGEGAQYLVGMLGALAALQKPWALALLALPTVLIYRSLKTAKEMHVETRRILESMADAVDMRDPYTGGHSRRVTEVSAGILRVLGKHGPEVDLIISAARVHDIGKIGIPDQVLKKKGPLTPEEWALMETHPDQGAELLRRYPDFARGADIVRHHHERWDGTGYPHRLKGTDIPFGARVIAVADSYDAMTSERPYWRGMSPHQAAAILREGRGRQWDASIVDALLSTIAEQLEQPAAAPLLRIVGDGLAQSRRATTA